MFFSTPRSLLLLFMVHLLLFDLVKELQQMIRFKSLSLQKYLAPVTISQYQTTGDDAGSLCPGGQEGGREGLGKGGRNRSESAGVSRLLYR